MTLDYDRHQQLIRHFSRDTLDTRTAGEISGIAAAIAYDGIISDDEIEMLQTWMKRHEDQAEVWPLAELHRLFDQFLKDGKVDAQERLRLFDFLSAIACSAEASGLASDRIYDESADVTIEGRSFVFTAKLDCGPRKKAQSWVVSLGGECHKSIRLDTDYLVVGALGTDNWKASRYGTKIEAVIYNRERKGASTKIVRELDFMRAVVSGGDV